METFIGWSEQDEESEFKSYYVVWKPIGIYLFSQGKAMFKSYYVVWKRTSPAFHAATLRAV